MMRAFRVFGAGLLVLTAFASLGAAKAADWPTKPVRLIVPFAAGGPADAAGRAYAEALSAEFAQQFVVENRTGGGGLPAAEAVARAEPDGNTVLLVANTFVINPELKRGNYQVATSFEPVCYLAATPMVLVVLGTSPYKTLADLIAAAHERPGQLAFASGGPASSLHVAIEVLRRAADLKINYVPYGGTAPAINTLMGGHVAAVWADYPTVVSQLQAGTLRGLVTTSHARVEPLPDVPTFAETGVSKYEADIFYGVVAPAKTPADKIAQWSEWFTAALKDLDMKPKLAKQGLFPVGTCGAGFAAYMRKLGDDYGRIIKEANITAN